MNNSIWVVIPAAGVGKRMQSDRPKQYLELIGRTVLEHTLDCFTQRTDIKGIVIGISQEDEYWPMIKPHLESGQNNIEILTSAGGNERCDTVLNALQQLLKHGANMQDWVMVHDAARPCLAQDDINTLIQQVSQATQSGTPLKQNISGGILAYPVHDTMKRQQTDDADDKTAMISHTEQRDGLWHALTPQMFRLGELHNALKQALEQQINITDEASALEAIQQETLLVEGRSSNIKITRPADLELAEFFLQKQQSSESA